MNGVVEAVGEGIKVVVDKGADMLGRQVMTMADIVEDQAKVMAQETEKQIQASQVAVKPVEEVVLGRNQVMDEQGVWDVQTWRRSGPKPKGQPQPQGQPKTIPVKPPNPKPQGQDRR